jgi:hypothetical protein
MVKPLKDILKEIEDSKPLRFQYGGYSGFEGEGGYTGHDSPAEFGDQAGRDLDVTWDYRQPTIPIGPLNPQQQSEFMGLEDNREPQERFITDDITSYTKTVPPTYRESTIPYDISTSTPQQQATFMGIEPEKDEKSRGLDMLANLIKQGLLTASGVGIPAQIIGSMINPVDIGTSDPTISVSAPLPGASYGLEYVLGGANRGFRSPLAQDIQNIPKTVADIGSYLSKPNLGERVLADVMSGPKEIESEVAEWFGQPKATEDEEIEVASSNALEKIITEQKGRRNEDRGGGGGPDDFGNDRDIIPIPVPAEVPASPVTVAEAGSGRPTYDLWQRGQEYGTAQYPYGGKPVYNVQAGGLIGLQHGSQGYLGYNKGGNVMNNNTQRYARGGLGGILRQALPLGVGWLTGGLGYGPAMGASALASYAASPKKDKWGIMDAAKAALIGATGVGIGRLGEAASTAIDIPELGDKLTPQHADLLSRAGFGEINLTGQGATQTNIDNLIDISASQLSAGPGQEKFLSQAYKDVSKAVPSTGNVARSMIRGKIPGGWGSYYDKLGRQATGLQRLAMEGGFEGLGAGISEIAGPISSGAAAQMITPPSERPTYEAIDEVTYKALTPEERRALARSSPLSRRFTFADFERPNVSLTAKSGGLLNAFARGDVVLEKLTEELNTRAGIDETVQEEPSNMVVDEAQEFLLDILRKLEVAGKNKGVNWREDPDLVSQGNRAIRHFYDEDIRELEETVVIKTAKGGVIDKNEELKSGSFVLPADVVSDVGDGSSSSGHRRLAQVFGGDSYARGGISGPVKGPGGGLDDLIQTSIDGVRAASLSNDEYVVNSKNVRKIGLKAGAKTRGEAQKKGAEQLHAFMKDVRLNKHNTPSQPKALRMAGLRNIV